MDECNPGRADCGSVSDDSYPTMVCQTTRTRARGLGKSTKEEKKYVRGRTSALGETGRASKRPRKRGLPRGCDGRRVHRQLHMPQDFLDDTSFHNRRNDPQPALLTHRAAFHVNREDALEQPCPRPVQQRAPVFGLPPSFSRRAVPRPANRATRVSSASPLRRHLSRPRSAALCLAAGRWGTAAAGRWGRGSPRQRGGSRWRGERRA